MQYVPLNCIFLCCGICGTFHTGLSFICSPHINVNNPLKLYLSNFPFAFETATITLGQCCFAAIVAVVDVMDGDMLGGDLGVNVAGCVGDIDALNVESVVGHLVGSIVGFVVGITVGIFVGIHVSPMVNDTIDELVNDIVGVMNGKILDTYIDSNVGLFDSDVVNEYEGFVVGLHIGNTVGLYVRVYVRIFVGLYIRDMVVIVCIVGLIEGWNVGESLNIFDTHVGSFVGWIVGNLVGVIDDRFVGYIVEL